MQLQAYICSNTFYFVSLYFYTEEALSITNCTLFFFVFYLLIDLWDNSNQYVLCCLITKKFSAEEDSIVRMYDHLFRLYVTDRHLGCFWPLAITNNTASRPPSAHHFATVQIQRRMNSSYWVKGCLRDFPGGPVVKNLPASAGYTGLISGLGGSQLPGGSDGKGPACNVRDLGSIPESGRSPGEGNSNPLQYSCLENSMDGGAW